MLISPKSHGITIKQRSEGREAERNSNKLSMPEAITIDLQILPPSTTHKITFYKLCHHPIMSPYIISSEIPTETGPKS